MLFYWLQISDSWSMCWQARSPLCRRPKMLITSISLLSTLIEWAFYCAQAMTADQYQWVREQSGPLMASLRAEGLAPSLCSCLRRARQARVWELGGGIRSIEIEFITLLLWPACSFLHSCVARPCLYSPDSGLITYTSQCCTLLVMQSALLATLLACWCLALRVDPQPDPHPAVSSVYFSDRQLFFLGDQDRTLGYIEKESGMVSLQYRLQEGERVLFEEQSQIILDSGLFLLQFAPYTRQVARSKPLVEVEAAHYRGYQRFDFGYYLLADNMLILNQFHEYNDHKHVIVSLQPEENALSIHRLKQLLVMASASPHQFCLTQIDYLQEVKKVCEGIPAGSPAPRVRVQGGYIYIIKQESTIIKDANLETLWALQEQPQQIYPWAVLLSGFRVFCPTSGVLSSSLLLIPGTDNSSGLSLEKLSGELHVKLDGQVLASFPRLSGDPIAVWANKVIGAQVLYELVLQLAHGGMHYYTLTLGQGQAVLRVLWSK